MGIKVKVGNLEQQLIDTYKDSIKQIFEDIQNKKAAGIEMTGWINWIDDTKGHKEIIDKATWIREGWKSKGVQKIVLVGTGGSYNGCRAGLEFQRNLFGNKDFDFIYAPYFSDRYLKELLDYLQDFKFSIVVISKSGTTLESAIAFRLLRELLAKKEGNNYREYVIAITDKSKGILKKVANKENFHTFTIQDNIGGRFSTLTAVGLVPMVLGGVDVERILSGAQKAKQENFNDDIANSKAALYAAFRHFMFENKGLVNECLISYDPHLRFTLEAIRQLFAESEGKDNKGLMPIILDFTPDLHSVGQLIQDGKKSFFETTFLVTENAYPDFKIEKSSFDNDDDLDWVLGKTLKEINNCAFSGTFDAHSNVGWIDNVVVEIETWNIKVFGYVYFWACLVAMFSSYLFKVNPFNQPGVETYKKRMFALLGKK